jgi:hypothetical protein
MSSNTEHLGRSSEKDMCIISFEHICITGFYSILFAKISRIWNTTTPIQGIQLTSSLDCLQKTPILNGCAGCKNGKE